MNIWNNRNWKPMLLKEIKKPFNSKDYIFEMKFDGIRAICFSNPTEFSIMTRNNVEISHLFPELKTIQKQTKKNVIFDGEIIALENGKPSFAKIQKRIHLKDKTKIQRAVKQNPVTFIAFDILYENKDLTGLTLLERKKKLEQYQDTEEFIKTKSIEKNGIQLFSAIKKQNLEGIVAKEKNGTYHINKRTDDFIKIKNIQRDKFIIGGYSMNKQKVSIYLGEVKDQKLIYIGKCSISPKENIVTKMINLKTTKNPFSNLKEEINFIKPTLSCSIAYLERTKTNQLRHPIFKGEL